MECSIRISGDHGTWHLDYGSAMQQSNSPQMFLSSLCLNCSGMFLIFNVNLQLGLRGSWLSAQKCFVYYLN
jgi:hypothetical protein